jgi:hypothetical protein
MWPVPCITLCCPCYPVPGLFPPSYVAGFLEPAPRDTTCPALNSCLPLTRGQLSGRELGLSAGVSTTSRGIDSWPRPAPSAHHCVDNAVFLSLLFVVAHLAEHPASALILMHVCSNSCEVEGSRGRRDRPHPFVSMQADGAH